VENDNYLSGGLIHRLEGTRRTTDRGGTQYFSEPFRVKDGGSKVGGYICCGREEQKKGPKKLARVPKWCKE